MKPHDENNVSNNGASGASSASVHKHYMDLNENDKMILSLIQKSDGIKTKDFSNQLSMPLRTVVLSFCVL